MQVGWLNPWPVTSHRGPVPPCLHSAVLATSCTNVAARLAHTSYQLPCLVCHRLHCCLLQQVEMQLGAVALLLMVFLAANQPFLVASESVLWPFAGLLTILAMLGFARPDW